MRALICWLRAVPYSASVILATAVIFYLPYSAVLAVLFWFALTVRFFIVGLKLQQQLLPLLLLILCHVLVLIGLFRFAPRGGMFRRIDTGAWNGQTIHAVLSDLEEQARVPVVLQFNAASEESLLLGTVEWDGGRMSVLDCVERLSRQTALEVIARMNASLQISLSGHHSLYDISVYADDGSDQVEGN